MKYLFTLVFIFVSFGFVNLLKAFTLKEIEKQPKVILVPGINDEAQKMRQIENFLRSNVRQSYSVTLIPSTGKLGIDELAIQLDSFIKAATIPEEKIDLIGFSMGGLVCRFYIQKLGGINKVAHFITLSTPHNGTLTGFLLNNKGAKQMRYRSNFINELNTGLNVLQKLKVTSIWTPFDLMIIPATSSKIPFGNKIKIWCLLHPLMVSNKKCLQSIELELKK